MHFNENNTDSLNNNMLLGAVIKLIEQAIDSSMSDLISSGINLPDNENKIRNHLYEKHLKSKPIDGLTITIEEPTGYIESVHDYSGRSDIIFRVNNRFLSNTRIITECKRIDGTTKLFNYYINDGVMRFLKHPIKYVSSLNFAFLICFNVCGLAHIQIYSEIEKIWKSTTPKYSVFNLLNNNVMFSEAKSDDNYVVNLRHLIYDLSKTII